MKAKVRFIAVLLAILTLCSCAKPVQPTQAESTAEQSSVPTAEITAIPTIEPTVEPTSKPAALPSAEPTAEQIETSDAILDNTAQADEAEPLYTGIPVYDREYMVENMNEINALLYEQDWTSAYIYSEYRSEYTDRLYAAAKSVFAEMPPFIIFASPSPQNADKDVFSSNVINDHDINNEAYAAHIMYRMITKYYWKCPNRYKHLIWTILPDEDIRALMKICFADFTDDMPLPDINKARYYNEDQFIHTEDGFRYYIEDDSKDQNPPTTNTLVLDMDFDTLDGYEDKEVFYLLLVTFSGFESYNYMNGQRVWLVKNDEPDALGCNWRIAKVVTLPSSVNSAGFGEYDESDCC